MKVQIQYRIDIDEVPSKIGQLVEEALAELNSKIDSMLSINELCKQGKHLETVHAALDDIRKELALADASLADAYAICSGLLKHTTQQTQPPPPPSPDIESTLKNVENKISELEQDLGVPVSDDVRNG